MTMPEVTSYTQRNRCDSVRPSVLPALLATEHTTSHMKVPYRVLDSPMWQQWCRWQGAQEVGGCWPRWAFPPASLLAAPRPRGKGSLFPVAGGRRWLWEQLVWHGQSCFFCGKTSGARSGEDGQGNSALLTVIGAGRGYVSEASSASRMQKPTLSTSWDVSHHFTHVHVPQSRRLYLPGTVNLKSFILILEDGRIIETTERVNGCQHQPGPQHRHRNGTREIKIMPHAEHVVGFH